MATPAVDYDALAKQAQGIDYDSLADAARTVDVSPEGRPVYRTTVTASPWDRAVDAFGEFTSMLQPTSGEPFEAKAEQIIRGIRDLPLYSANSLNNFYGSLSKGDMPGAAYHLAGVVPILGHMSQRISDDLKAGHYSEAAGHFMGILATAGLMWPDQPIDSLQSAVDTVKDIPNAVGTKTGDVILKLPPQAAKVLGRAAGGTTGAIVGGPIGAGWGASKGDSRCGSRPRVRPHDAAGYRASGSSGGGSGTGCQRGSTAPRSTHRKDNQGRGQVVGQTAQVAAKG